jgi:hypothetical protein
VLMWSAIAACGRVAFDAFDAFENDIGDEVAFQDGIAPDPSYAGTRDATLDSNVPMDRMGDNPIISADGSHLAGEQVLLLAWNISMIPPGRRVANATIILARNGSNDPYPVHALGRTFDELSTSWLEAAAGMTWEVAGARGPSDRSPGVIATVPAMPMDEMVALAIPLTTEGVAIVQRWIDDPSSNQGVVIADSTRNDGLEAASRENPDPSARPRLELVLRPK